jgi:hypothetical protein
MPSKRLFSKVSPKHNSLRGIAMKRSTLTGIGLGDFDYSKGDIIFGIKHVVPKSSGRQG